MQVTGDPARTTGDAIEAKTNKVEKAAIMKRYSSKIYILNLITIAPILMGILPRSYPRPLRNLEIQIRNASTSCQFSLAEATSKAEGGWLKLVSSQHLPPFS